MVGSNSAKNDLSKMGIPADNINVIPHGVIIKKPEPLPEKEKIKTIVFLGALTKDKEVEDALKAFAILDRNGRFQFWVIGHGSTKYQKFLKNLCKKLNIQNKVKFWGFISQEKKFKLLARAHILVNPSIREGWGLVNIEANAMRTPVIAYRVPGLIDSVKNGESGILCRENTPEALAQESSNLVKNEKLWKMMQKSALLWSRKFSWNKSKKISLQLLNRVASIKGSV
jgi:glycosyltransferase involved in cell wall biosynthesis